MNPLRTLIAPIAVMLIAAGIIAGGIVADWSLTGDIGHGITLAGAIALAVAGGLALAVGASLTAFQRPQD